MSWGPHWPWPEHALGHSARAMPSDAIAVTATRILPLLNLIVLLLFVKHTRFFAQEINSFELKKLFVISNLNL
jgi:hypothetical protein